ncbi:MAG: TetR/AcrR family transcriptional regulator [Propionibacteriaceae bacterium]|nr:TetR/AcrR family transcriptional regulator [Propionibacteriaceae bacterium]
MSESIANGSGTPEGRRVVELLWDPPEPAMRGPRPKVSLDQVVTTAMELADAEGYAGLSMRSLARRLGIGAMSLYTYVPGKTELFELMIDRAYAERSRPNRSWPWRRRYEQHASEALAMYRRHPWLVDSNLWRLPVGPHVLDISEDLLAIGRDAGLSLKVGARVSQLLESYIFAIARGEVADQAQAARTGESVDDYWAARSSFWTTYFDTQRYPTMLATWEGGFYDDDDPAADLQFALGLILDSVERLIGR